MSSTMSRTWAKRAAVGVSAAVGLYAVFLGLILNPTIQRFALYAHYFNTALIHDINNPEQFGFAKHQVTPFNIHTADGEILYAWHVLPIDVYAKHEKALLAQQRTQSPTEDLSQKLAFKLLSKGQSADRPARVVINFHGNAGHLANGWRTDTYRNLATQPNTHVITVDYRGFGKSTGSPTEAGLIIDGIAVVEWVMQVAKVPPERIVIVGQSLGTAVSSAVSLYFADPQNALIPAQTRETFGKPKFTAVAFAGVVLIAPFWSFPVLIRTYRIGGLMPPVLLPFHLPWTRSAYGYATGRIVDTWESGQRLAAYYNALGRNSRLKSGYADPDGGHDTVRDLGSLQLIHAVNDADIWYHNSRLICETVLDSKHSEACLSLQADEHLEVKEVGKPKLRVDIASYGGHNRIVTYAPVAAAVVRAFEGL